MRERFAGFRALGAPKKGAAGAHNLRNVHRCFTIIGRLGPRVNAHLISVITVIGAISGNCVGARENLMLRTRDTCAM